MSVQSLFDAVGLAPSLPGAKCRGRHSLFDDAATGEDVPSSVELRWRSGEHQAALT